MQNIGGFGHFHHEGRATAGQIIRRADAREDAVQTGQRDGTRRYKGPDVSQEGDQGVLAHIGRLTAHVGAGNQQHAAVMIEVGVVGNKRHVAHGLHDGVASALDLKQGAITEPGPA